jgi:signal transduction histidine kinase
MGIFNRIFWKVYLTIVGTLVLVVAVSALVWRVGPEMDAARNAFEMAVGVVTAALADPGAAPAEQQRAVERLGSELKTDLALYAPDGTLLGASGAALPTPPDAARYGDRWFQRMRGPIWTFRLPDARVIVVRAPLDAHRHDIGFFGYLAIVALVLAIGSFPIVRGLTRRLERLQHGVESLGAGDLTARVKVEGRDEVARVAESFNRAATRIEELVRAHKMLLANASHELRTPLTRLRMGIELLKDKTDPQRRTELEHDIAELDQLIDEILLSSRLDAMKGLESVDDVDLLALAAEEGARYEHASVSGDAAVIRGDARLLRRLIRNLIENAERHGAPPIDVTVKATAMGIDLTVLDRGPGIAAADSDRIFEPFFRATTAGARQPGTGLGLSLVRQIARSHGGDVKVAEEDGRHGFAVFFPKRLA